MLVTIFNGLQHLVEYLFCLILNQWCLELDEERAHIRCHQLTHDHKVIRVLIVTLARQYVRVIKPVHDGVLLVRKVQAIQ